MKRIPKLPKGIAPVGERTDLSNVKFVSFTQPNRKIVEQKDSKVIFVDFHTRQKIGHVS